MLRNVYASLEKPYDRVSREGLWEVLGMYGVKGRLLDAVKSLYAGSRANARLDS